MSVIRLSDSIFKLCHRVPHVISRSLDVVSGRGADIRTPQYSLNDDLRNSQTVQIAPEPAPRGMPTTPFRD